MGDMTNEEILAADAAEVPMDTAENVLPTEITTPESAEAIEADVSYLEEARAKREPAPERKALQALNQRKVNALEGVGYSVFPTLMITRLETLIEYLLGVEGDAQRDALDEKFEQALAPKLDEVAAQVKAQIMQQDAQAGMALLAQDGKPVRK